MALLWASESDGIEDKQVICEACHDGKAKQRAAGGFQM